MNNIFKIILFMPTIFFFLPGFCFYLPGIKGIYRFYYISLYIVLPLLFILDWKYIKQKIVILCKKTSLIYFFIFIGAICLNSFLLAFLDKANLEYSLYSIVMQIVLNIIPTIIYFIIIIDKYISLKRFIKIFMFMFWLNLILGCIAYIGRWFDITFINYIFDFFNNQRNIEVATIGTTMGGTTESYFLEYRLCGLFEEPGLLGQFLFIFLPFVYSFAQTEVKLFKNTYFNTFFKYSIIPLTWINIIMTLSPITLIFSCAITFLYYLKIFIFLLRKYTLQLGICLIFIIFYIIQAEIDLTEIYIIRIFNVFTKVHSFEDFINVEPSLATRVVSYINEFKLFLRHPLTGVGFGNLKYQMYEQFLNSPVPFTQEIIIRTSRNIQQGIAVPMFNVGFMYGLLAENGIIIYSILVYFYIKVFNSIKYFLKRFKTDSIDYLICKSIFYTLICLAMLSIYNLSLISQYLHLVIALSVLCIYKYKVYERICQNA